MSTRSSTPSEGELPLSELNEDSLPLVQEADETSSPTRVPQAIALRLYLSHFLSTWNSRVFEFGAVLYLATIFPNTLLPMSIYAVARAAAAVFFSPTVGRYIDIGNRLKVVRLSIREALILVISDQKLIRI